MIRPLRTAIKKRYIQFNPPHALYWIVLDIDMPIMGSLTMSKILEGEIPQPNFLVENRENGHAHAFFGLKTPVAKGDHASKSALNYVAAIEAALIRAFGADALYTNLISKNPLNPHWNLIDLRSELYTLGELHKKLDLRGPSKNIMRRIALEEAKAQGIARNCQMFNRIRSYAYQTVREYRQSASFNEWQRLLVSKAEVYNDFPDPLLSKELSHIVKSVARWTWSKYTAKSAAEFSRLQAERGAKGGIASAQKRSADAGSGDAFNEKMRQLGKRNGKGISAAQPWLEEGISRSQWYRDKKKLVPIESTGSQPVLEAPTQTTQAELGAWGIIFEFPWKQPLRTAPTPTLHNSFSIDLDEEDEEVHPICLYDELGELK
ncbi:replication initiation protein [Pseudomonas rossensis]|uniref:replication initiation protein n=1 Tax=Pseudomonas rossensis TaxID=2305471 RepID=UPI003261C549